MCDSIFDHLPKTPQVTYRQLTKQQCLTLLEKIGSRLVDWSPGEHVITADSEDIRYYSAGEFWLDGPYQMTKEQHRYLCKQSNAVLSDCGSPPEGWEDKGGDDDWWVMSQMCLRECKPEHDYYRLTTQDDWSDLDFYTTLRGAEAALCNTAYREGSPNEVLIWGELTSVSPLNPRPTAVRP